MEVSSFEAIRYGCGSADHACSAKCQPINKVHEDKNWLVKGKMCCCKGDNCNSEDMKMEDYSAPAAPPVVNVLKCYHNDAADQTPTLKDCPAGDIWCHKVSLFVSLFSCLLSR